MKKTGIWRFLLLGLGLRLRLASAEAASVTNDNVIEYGVDTSFPMHYNHVHTNYAWLASSNSNSDNNGNGSNRTKDDGSRQNPHDEPIQPLGDKQSFYDRYLQGCMKYHEAFNRSNDCITNEKGRIAMSLRQPKSMHNYTELGYAKIRAPTELFDMIQRFWSANRDQMVLESWTTGVSYVNHWESPTYMLYVEDAEYEGGGAVLQQAIWNSARDILSKWTQQEHLAECSLYGIRIYKQDAILAPHVDRLPLVISAIINVDQDVDEPWPLEVIGRDGKAVNVTMEPGDMVLYESHSIIHGRPFPLQGKFMANVFIHFEPTPTDNIEDINPTELPQYIIPGSEEEANWRKSFPTGYPAPIKHLEAKDAAIDGDTQFLRDMFTVDPSAIRASDSNGWQPLHQAIRYGHLDTVKALIDEFGANINRRTYRNKIPNEGGTPLYWAKHFRKDDGSIVKFLQDRGAIYLAPGDKYDDAGNTADDTESGEVGNGSGEL